jgi:hypothetical protein
LPNEQALGTIDGNEVSSAFDNGLSLVKRKKALQINGLVARIDVTSEDFL